MQSLSKVRKGDPCTAGSDAVVLNHVSMDLGRNVGRCCARHRLEHAGALEENDEDMIDGIISTARRELHLQRPDARNLSVLHQVFVTSWLPEATTALAT